MACPWDSVPWARLGEEDEWRDLFAEVPRDVQSHRPWLLSAPSVCMNSQPGKREILSLSWRGAHEDQLVQPPRFTDNNYDYA